jgi:hypothetical protein
MVGIHRRIDTGWGFCCTFISWMGFGLGRWQLALFLFRMDHDALWVAPAFLDTYSQTI